MTRWAPDAAGRLHAAALELFLEHGFAATTVPEIAERAGLTTRSFFRYYADKREVLFVGEDELPGVVEQMFDDSDPSLSPMEMIHVGLAAVVVPRLECFREELLTRRAIVESDESLGERELRKLAILQTAGTAAFGRRGLSPLDADLAGRLAVAIYHATLDLWLAHDATEPLGEVLDDVVRAMTRVSATPQATSSS